MKNLILILSFLGCVTFANAQELPDFSIIGLETESDFNENADDAALVAANYLLKTPIGDDIQRKKAGAYLVRWMNGTPVYTFMVDISMVKLSNDDPELLNVMMAAMAEYVLKNKADKDDAEKVRLGAVRRFISYTSNSSFKAKQNGEIKKAIAADKKGELKQHLVKISE